MPRCPECDSKIRLDPEDVEKGEILDCPECGIELEVVDVDPFILDYAPDDDLGDTEEE